MRKPNHATVVAYVALFIAMGGTASAATGGHFILGRSNSESNKATLSNSSGTPLALRAKSGYPALSVNTSKQVAHLNASMLGGYPAFYLLKGGDIVLRSNGTCPNHYIDNGAVSLTDASDPGVTFTEEMCEFAF